MRLELLVEGHGDVKALPSLVTRCLSDAGFFVGHPILAGTAIKFVHNKGKFKKYIKSRLEYNPEAILYFSDCDEECPLHLAETLYDYAKEALIETQSSVRFAICIFNPEYEVFFLVSWEKIPDCEECTVDVDMLETRRDAKGMFERMIGKKYKETTHQKEFTRYIDYDAIASVRCGRHLHNVFEWLKNSTVQFYCD